MLTSPEIITKAEDKEYSIVRLSKDRLADLAGLHSTVYTPVHSDHYTKKYNTAYTGIENVGYIAYSKTNEPIAYYGVLPCFLRYENKIIVAAQSADTMTHPKYRYKGLFVELSKMTFDLCRQLNIRVLFGFPNQNSYHGAVTKLGWTMTEAMDGFVIPVATAPVEALSKKTKLLARLYEQYKLIIFGKALLPLHGLPNSVIADGYAGVDRSKEFFAYKNFSPTTVLKIRNSKVWISCKHGLLIGDMEGIDQTNFIQVINRLKNMARKLGIRQIQFHSSPGTNLHQLFSAHYEPLPSYPVLFQDFGSSIPLEKIKFSFADIDIF